MEIVFEWIMATRLWRIYKFRFLVSAAIYPVTKKDGRFGIKRSMVINLSQSLSFGLVYFAISRSISSY